MPVFTPTVNQEWFGECEEEDEEEEAGLVGQHLLVDAGSGSLRALGAAVEGLEGGES